jgi:predicted patatin/cPLA2 family phospholipase
MVNLIIGGGNFKGLAYLGAVEYLYKKGLLNKIDNFYGTSVGTIIGVLFCASISPLNILNILLETNFDEHCNMNMLNIEKSYSLITHSIFDIIDNEFKKNNIKDITIKQYYDKFKIKLNIYATSLKHRKKINFNKETFPDLKVIEAVKASCSIPILFPPVIINNEYYVDGCLKSIDGIFYSDINKDEINYIIKSEYSNNEINSFMSYLSQVVNSLLDNNECIDIDKTIIFKFDNELENKYNFNDVDNSLKLKLFFIGLTTGKNTIEKLN